MMTSLMMGFYVYIYWYQNEPIYVGKGKDDRMWWHVLNCQKKNSYFYNKLRKILAEDPDHLEITCEFKELSETRAFELEKELIKEFGRKDLGTGSLYNLTDGGEGSSGYKHTKECKKQKSEKLLLAYKDKAFLEAHKQAMKVPKSESHKDALSKPKGKQPLITCPHCGKEGGSNTMQRWHFDNCKLKCQ